MSFLPTTHIALFLCFCFFAEILRGGEKIQTRPLAFFLLFLPLAVCGNYCTWVLEPDWLWVSVLIWLSSFLCWFGVRSHLESSILFRLLILARPGRASESELLERYHRYESFSERTDILKASGLLGARDGLPTKKARFLLRLFALFGGGPDV